MISQESLERLSAVICAIADVPASEWEYFSGLLHEREFGTGQTLLQAGDRVREFYFVINGLLRYFYLTPGGKEFNKAFAKEDDFAGSIGGLISGAPSRFSIEAMEDTRVIVLPVELIIEGYDRHRSWERLGRRLAENVALKKELREAEFLLDPAEARYLRFLKEFADISERISQYHIASYLGITEVSLSRIRRKL